MGPSSRFQHFGHLLQNLKPQKMKNESSSPIPPKKYLPAQPFAEN